MTALTPTTPTRAPITPNALPSHIPALDGLRGIAILMVFIHNYTAHNPQASPLSQYLSDISASGWIGVDLFFVLSGFLITGILADIRGTPRALTHFYARRTLRIFPLYFATLAVVLLILPLFLPSTPATNTIRANQIYLWTYTLNIPMAFNPNTYFHADYISLSHFWSLAVEEHFYLLWPAVILLLPKRLAIPACLACIPLAFAARLGLILTGNAPGTYFFTLCRIDALAIGSLAALLVRRPAGLPPLLKPARIAFFLLAGGFLLLALAKPGLHPHQRIIMTVGYPLLATAFAAFLLLALQPNTPLSRALSLKPLRILGLYSYGIYVLHLALKPAFDATILQSDFVARTFFHNALTGALLLAITLAAAALVYHTLEYPFLRLKRHFPMATNHPPQPQPQPASSQTLSQHV